jgi:hypothetical protein
VVELKKKPPPLVVTMEDGTKRSILVDPTALGGDLAEVIVEGTTEDHNKRYHRMAIHPAVHHHLLPRLTPPPLYSSFCRPPGCRNCSISTSTAWSEAPQEQGRASGLRSPRLRCRPACRTASGSTGKQPCNGAAALARAVANMRTTAHAHAHTRTR